MNNDFQKIIIDDTAYESFVTPKFLKRKPYIPFDEKKLLAVIPGVIQHVFIYSGKLIKRNDDLLILEAMKMKNAVKAPHDGRVKTVHVKNGEMVVKGQLLVEFE